MHARKDRKPSPRLSAPTRRKEQTRAKSTPEPSPSAPRRQETKTREPRKVDYQAHQARMKTRKPTYRLGVDLEQEVEVLRVNVQAVHVQRLARRHVAERRGVGVGSALDAVNHPVWIWRAELQIQIECQRQEYCPVWGESHERQRQQRQEQISQTPEHALSEAREP